MADSSPGQKWPRPRSAEEREEMRATAAAIGIDAEIIWSAHLRFEPANTKTLQQWSPLTDAEYRKIEPFLPASVRGARGAPPRTLLNVLLHRAATGATAWRGVANKIGMDPDNARQKWTRWVLAGVLDRLLGARGYLKLTPGRREQLDALAASVLEEQRRLQQRDAVGTRI